jgi:agmatine deiminase
MRNLIPQDSMHLPAEWEKHKACWLAWPSHQDLWEENLGPARAEFVGLCRAIANGEPLEVLVPDPKMKSEAEHALHGLSVRFHLIPFGDIWLRDTAPLFLKGTSGETATARFNFNGWGEKYILPHDSEVSARIAHAAQLKEISYNWILEGGAIDVDGQGTCLTTRQCLLNKNRGSNTESVMTSRLKEALGVEKVLWLEDGLLNDHTDGHVDTLARFIAPGVVLCMKSTHSRDPNFAVLKEIADTLRKKTDARGRKLEVIEIPSPGTVLDGAGEIMPASYMNFLIANSAVVVPVYGSEFDDAAVAAISEAARKYLPERRVIGLPSKTILSGGGAFHCITRQQTL